MKISAVFIAKNEEKLVRAALESVKDFDEIIFVDTGSTDKTREIAKQYTDNIYYFPWCDDFSKARNFANSKATGDWIYSIDSDHQLLTPYKEVKKELQKADATGHVVAMIKSISSYNHVHWRDVLFKNTPSIFWKGAVHECLSVASSYHSSIERKCGYSENHHKDPDRNLRILQKSEKTTRTLFYLGREFYEKKKYREAISNMKEYLNDGKWLPELTEAHLTIAKSLWHLQEGDKARAECLETIRINPDCKEALILMSKMHFSPKKEKWANFATVAQNRDVLFIRT